MALLVELMSRHIALSWTCTSMLVPADRSWNSSVELAGDDPKQFGLHSLRIGGDTLTPLGPCTPVAARHLEKVRRI